MIKPKKITTKPPPKAHVKLIKTVQDAMFDLGWACCFDAYAVSHDRHDIVASYVVEPLIDPPTGFEFMLAIKSSRARRWATTMNPGVRHQETGAMLALGRVRPGTRRHTEEEQLIRQALPGCLALFETADPRLHKLSTTQIPAVEMALELCGIGSMGILSWSRVGHTYDIMRTPRTRLELALQLALEIDRSPDCARKDQVELRLQLMRQLEA